MVPIHSYTSVGVRVRDSTDLVLCALCRGLGLRGPSFAALCILQHVARRLHGGGCLREDVERGWDCSVACSGTALGRCLAGGAFPAGGTSAHGSGTARRWWAVRGAVDNGERLLVLAADDGLIAPKVERGQANTPTLACLR